MQYDEQWLRDFIIEEMECWDREDIVRFYDGYSFEDSISEFRMSRGTGGAFYVHRGGKEEEELCSEYVEGVEFVEIKSDKVKRELLAAVEMMLL